MYLVPLLEELQLLWKGVYAWDVTRLEQRFKFQGLLMWANHELLAYGLFLGQVTKGYKGYPTYGPNTTSHHSKKLGKTTYIHHSKWLKLNHQYQANAHDFNGKSEKGPAPPLISRFDVLSHANFYEDWKLQGGREEDNPCHDNGVKRRSCLFDLPYLQVGFIVIVDLIWFLVKNIISNL